MIEFSQWAGCFDTGHRHKLQIEHGQNNGPGNSAHTFASGIDCLKK